MDSAIQRLNNPGLAFLETRLKLSRVILYKDFWDVTGDRAKKMANSWPARPQKRSQKSLQNLTRPSFFLVFIMVNLQTSRARVKATWRLGLRNPLIARNRLEVRATEQGRGKWFHCLVIHECDIMMGSWLSFNLIPVGLDREKAPGEKIGVKKENEISPFGQSRVKSTRKEERVRGRVLSRLSSRLVQITFGGSTC